MDKPGLRLGHLYPELMNIYGDRGNVIVLVQRARWHGLEPEVIPVRLGEPCDFRTFDLLCIGGGQDRDQSLICADFQNAKGSDLIAAADDGVALLAVCGGYQLLGQYYQTGDGQVMPGIGLFDARTEASSDRMIGNVVIETSLFGDDPRTLVGFENHSGKTYLGPSARPLGRLIKGFGNNGQDGHEGAVYRHSVGTYLHGSVLPKNPSLADWLLSRAVERRYGDRVQMRPLDDDLEDRAHAAAVKKVLGRALKRPG